MSTVPPDEIAPVDPAPLRIEIGLANKTSPKFKSISHLVWENIPGLAVLTGLNGSGKTQVLELLAYRLMGTQHPTEGMLPNIPIHLSDPQIVATSVVYLSSKWSIDSSAVLGVAELQATRHNLYQDLRQHHNIQNDPRRKARRVRLEKLLGASLDSISAEDFAKRLPDHFSFMLDDEDISDGLAHVFLGYHYNYLDEISRDTPRDRIVDKLGPAPWDVLNEILKAAEFPYEVVSPKNQRILDRYEVRLRDPATNVILSPPALSSGEKMLFRLVLWLYNSSHHNQFPKLLLLDEPDAHLHPSMTRHFLNVLKDVLVDKYKVRVILSTHSPSTVALAPKWSLFEMSKSEPRIRPVASRQAAIGLLTAGLVTVAPGSRFVFVEDAEDVFFYNAVREMLSDFGPSRDKLALQPAPSIVFISASLGSGKTKIAGGCTVVKQWLEKLNEPPLTELFSGIIDRDTANSTAPRLHVINRYSIENYLLDPTIVFALLHHR